MGWVLVFERHHDMAVGMCRYVGMDVCVCVGQQSYD